MIRTLVAHLPCFRLERCGWEAHQPVVLLAEDKRVLRVVSATPAATRAGVRPGMSAAEARALLPGLRTEVLDVEAEHQDLEALAEQLLRLSPSVSTLPPEALVAELRGEAAEPGGERAALERARARLAQLGHQARIAIADDPATALAVATWGTRCHIVPPGQSAAALAPLPLEALGLPNDELVLLQGLGVRTVGAFAALPPAAVVGRLGPLGVAAHALARGKGPGAPMMARPSNGQLQHSQDLMEPVADLQALLFVLNALLRDTTTALAASGKAAVRLVLRFRLEGGGEQELSVRLGEPTRDPKAILALLRTRLERFQLSGLVCAVAVEIPEPVPFHSRQRGLMDWHAVGEALSDVMARLQDQLGESSVRVPRLVARHRPESEWRAAPFRAASTSGSSALALQIEDDPALCWEGNPTPALPERPPILLPMPLALDVQAGGDALPQALLLDGRWVGVQDLHGPELLTGEWWDRPFHRAYWQAALADGRRAWIYREDGRWALHGWWDR